MQVSGPQLSISIYPFEGGQYTISGTNAGVLQAQINTSLKGGTGTFSLALAPGGPNGVNARPYWTELLTPMSLVIIGLSRGSYNQTPMIAVVTS
ncbi:MAG: hypothetical protein KGI54_18570, partial [Pseudomonadota bacterium]|nr:hypothetical protein [Pseudomonadota bacterium]MDE3023825.1 hypothetical protein [Pseudomonadota bacterium]